VEEQDCSEYNSTTTTELFVGHYTSLISSVKYIVGARLKSLPKSLQDQITGLDFSADTTHELVHKNRRIIVSYSHSRAKRIAPQRERSVTCLKGLIMANKAVKKHQYLDYNKGKTIYQ
jgi:hypothetical protein